MDKAKKFIQRLLLELAEKDFLDPAIPIEEVVANRCQWKTKNEYRQLINIVKKWRTNGKVNWRDKIEIG